jgi:hypothetical protein
MTWERLAGESRFSPPQPRPHTSRPECIPESRSHELVCRRDAPRANEGFSACFPFLDVPQHRVKTRRGGLEIGWPNRFNVRPAFDVLV